MMLRKREDFDQLSALEVRITELENEVSQLKSMLKNHSPSQAVNHKNEELFGKGKLEKQLANTLLKAFSYSLKKQPPNSFGKLF